MTLGMILFSEYTRFEWATLQYWVVLIQELLLFGKAPNITEGQAIMKVHRSFVYLQLTSHLACVSLEFEGYSRNTPNPTSHELLTQLARCTLCRFVAGSFLYHGMQLVETPEHLINIFTALLDASKWKLEYSMFSLVQFMFHFAVCQFMPQPLRCGFL